MEDRIENIQKKIIDFRNKRDWEQFHNPKDVALSLVLEAAEVMEHFQWKNNAEIKEYIQINKHEISEELADVFYWILLLSYDLKIDIIEALEKKLIKNELKYPVEKSRGRHVKYNKL